MHLDAADVAAKFMDLTVKLESELHKRLPTKLLHHNSFDSRAGTSLSSDSKAQD